MGNVSRTEVEAWVVQLPSSIASLGRSHVACARRRALHWITRVIDEAGDPVNEAVVKQKTTTCTPDGSVVGPAKHQNYFSWSLLLLVSDLPN
mmetsp:Transcript_30255/g.54740  ORF Transcript_30255/g.54740 Transcript_30255/m.54740 type:complete len:92 (+) Transcript_30255:392-667(+)